jgi:hypothetical protein
MCQFIAWSFCISFDGKNATPVVATLLSFSKEFYPLEIYSLNLYEFCPGWLKLIDWAFDKYVARMEFRNYLSCFDNIYLLLLVGLLSKAGRLNFSCGAGNTGQTFVYMRAKVYWIHRMKYE